MASYETTYVAALTSLSERKASRSAGEGPGEVPSQRSCATFNQLRPRQVERPQVLVHERRPDVEPLAGGRAQQAQARSPCARERERAANRAHDEWKRPTEWQSNVGLHSAEKRCAERDPRVGHTPPRQANKNKKKCFLFDC